MWYEDSISQLGQMMKKFKRNPPPWSYIPLIGLLVITAGLFFLWLVWKNNTISQTIKGSGHPTPTSSPTSANRNLLTQTQTPQAPPLQRQPVPLERNPTTEFSQRVDLIEEVQVPSGIFSYGGAHTFAAISALVNKAIAATHPAFQLRYTEPFNNKPGSGTGIAMLLDKQLSFAHSGRPLEDEEYAKAKTRGFRVQQIPVALDAIAFYTHPKINLPGLSIRQVQAIFLGKITNWKQVGGPNLPIKPFAVEPKLTSAVQILFEGIDNAQLGHNVRIMRDYTEIIRQVAVVPGSISYASAPLVQGQKTIRPLALSRGNSKQYVQPFTSEDLVNATAIRDGSYPLSRRLFVVIRRDGTLDEQGGLAYTNLLLSQEGQRLIDRAGFVPLLGTK